MLIAGGTLYIDGDGWQAGLRFFLFYDCGLIML